MRARRIPLAVGLALVCLAGPVASQPRPRKPPRPPITEICLAPTWGQARCATVVELRRLLGPAQVARLLARIEAGLESVGLDAGRDALLGCGTGTPSTAVASGSPEGAKRGGLTRADVAEVERILGACRAEARASSRLGSRVGGRGERGGGGGYEGAVAAAVSRADEALGQCRDGGNPWISQGADAGPVESERLRRFRTVGVLQESLPPQQAPKPEGEDPGESSLFTTRKHGGSGGGASGGSGTGGETGGTGTGGTGGTGSTGGGASGGTPATPSPTPTPDEEECQETPCGPDDPEGGDDQPAPAPPPDGCGETPGCGPPPTPCEGDGCTASCEERQRAWEMFKEYCAQSDWQAYQCADFVRKLNGCVDMTLINPGPEGDLTCPAWGRDDDGGARRAWAEDCKRRSMIMMPVPDGRSLCALPAVLDTPALGIDPCNDPRVLPSPDACSTGAPVDDVTPRPRPSPEGLPDGRD